MRVTAKGNEGRLNHLRANPEDGLEQIANSGIR